MEITGKQTTNMCACGEHLVYIGSVENGINIHCFDGHRVTMWASDSKVDLTKYFENFKKITDFCIPNRTCPEGEDLKPKELISFCKFLSELHIEWYLQEFEGDKLLYNVSNHSTLQKYI